ncbi:hypothetical protein M514_11214 [Trichuris suis]|uniref:Uncharacterized protein n=1 Tax=Trichuris suis TaxID=68888 RepID=A0A085NEU8_9BILA|nr:hypothetical protein M513_11214 [Trichuris suis]KFD67994.1 hypothetical protein M514_11214 [Trichuris suis]
MDRYKPTDAMIHFSRTVKFDEERYVAKLPRKADFVDLPNTCEEAKETLFQTEEFYQIETEVDVRRSHGRVPVEWLN